MEIFKRIEKNKIEGINIADLYNYLSYRDSNVTVDNVISDVIYLTNNKCIKCICNYYEKNNGIKIKKDRNANACFKVTKFFNINCHAYQCRECHIAAINMLREKKIKIK